MRRTTWGAVISGAVTTVVFVDGIAQGRFEHAWEQYGLWAAVKSHIGLALVLLLVITVGLSVLSAIQGGEPGRKPSGRFEKVDEAERNFLMRRGVRGLANWMDKEHKNGNANALPTAMQALNEAQRIRRQRGGRQ